MENLATINSFDTIIVGGGPAGLSAALLLGRSLKRVLVIDSGKPRNAVSHGANGFLSRDGLAPLELLQIGREQLAKYDTVKFHSGKVIDAQHLDPATQTGRDGFEVTLDNGVGVGGASAFAEASLKENRFTARKLLLATGVRDILPDLDGFTELWGTGVFHCPYCHGWEVRDKSLAIYGKGAAGVEQAMMLTGWSRDLILFSDGDAGFNDEQRQKLAKWGIEICEEKMVGLEGENGALTGVMLANGQVIPRDGIFLHPKLQQQSDLAKKLGCDFAENSFGIFTSIFTENSFIRVGEDKQTSVPGLYAVGDTSSLLSQLTVVAAAGVAAAVSINRALIEENLAVQN
jgi:thioredoxin reductase